jgi:hypothetical protein
LVCSPKVADVSLQEADSRLQEASPQLYVGEPTLTGYVHTPQGGWQHPVD